MGKWKAKLARTGWADFFRAAACAVPNPLGRGSIKDGSTHAPQGVADCKIWDNSAMNPVIYIMLDLSIVQQVTI